MTKNIQVSDETYEVIAAIHDEVGTYDRTLQYLAEAFVSGILDAFAEGHGDSDETKRNISEAFGEFLLSKTDDGRKKFGTWKRTR